MKSKILLLVTFLFYAIGSLTAQDTVANVKRRHIVKISPLGLIQKARIAYEQVLPGTNGKVSLGIIGAFYYDSDYKGLILEPMIRYYLDGNATGFYFQGKVTAGRVKSTVFFKQATTTYYDSTGNFTGRYNILNHYISRDLTTIGGSISLGYQFSLTNNKRWLLDFNIGLQYAHYFNNSDFAQTIYSSNGSKRVLEYRDGKIYPYYDAGPPKIYMYMNPGSLITSNLFIAYRF